jgi:3-oxoacyl-[acyl-carrier protein] reductase
MGKLNGKVAVVTGAGKGIGAGIAAALAAEGAAVTVNYAHDVATADKVVEMIRKDAGRAIAVKADVSRPDDVAALFASTREAFGPVDILVNNAGVFRFGPLESITVAEFHRHFDTNVLGTLLASQEFAAQREADGGSIINITSVGVSFAQPNASLYTSTKTAQVGLTRTLSVELAPRGIRVNAIVCGTFHTDSFHASVPTAELQAGMAMRVALGRIASADEIVGTALFLASDASSYMTGELLVVDGG